MAMYQLTVSPKALSLDVFGMTAEPGRPVWAYENGERTENQRVNDAGSPLFRHPALLRVPGDRPFESSVLLDREEGLGEFVQVTLSSDSVVAIRGARSEYGGVELSVTGSVMPDRKDKQGA